MYGVVLAAGRGTRMRPLTDRRPKPLLPVGDRSLLEHAFDAARDVVDAYVVVVGYRGDAIREAIGDAYRGRPVYYVEQETPRGTAIAATEVADPRAYGVISLGEDGSLSGIVEKPADPPTSLANVGCYAFESDVFEYIDRTPESDRGEYEITTTLALLIEAGHRVSVARYDGTWRDVGHPWDLLTATEIALEDLSGTVDGSVEGSVEGAVEDARTEAEVYAEATDQSLGEPTSMETTDTGHSLFRQSYDMRWRRTSTTRPRPGSTRGGSR